MLRLSPTPLIRLGNLFPDRKVFAKCEFALPSGCFKIRGACHLLEHLRRAGGEPLLIVPSSGNTAVGAAVAAQAFGLRMVGVVPETIAQAKDEKLRALGVELVKIAGGGSELLSTAKQLADERGGYFVHPHLDTHWTDGYRAIAAEIVEGLPTCRSLVFPVGGGGLLMGLAAELREGEAPAEPGLPKVAGSAGASPSPRYAVKFFGCEPHNYPKYARFQHQRSKTIADGLVLEVPHPTVQQAIAELGIGVSLVTDADIRTAMRMLFETQGLVVEPSSAIALATVQAQPELEEPICVVLTGENIAREEFYRLIARD